METTADTGVEASVDSVWIFNCDTPQEIHALKIHPVSTEVSTGVSAGVSIRVSTTGVSTRVSTRVSTEVSSLAQEK